MYGNVTKVPEPQRCGWKKGVKMNQQNRIIENRTTVKDKTTDANRDPITGTPGAHPVGTGIGAAGAGAAGAAIGAAVGGPIGAAVGLAAGAIAGGLAGKGAAEAVNPTHEEAYWRENYTSQPWVERNRSFDDYHPAFRTGYEGYSRYSSTGKTYDELEPELRKDYEKVKGKSSLAWDKARTATRAAWERLERPVENRLHNTTTGSVRPDANRDPITGAPGAHPVGTGVGAAGGAAAGAAVGAAVGGPIGAGVGLAAGAIAGGLAGKGAAEAVNPTEEDAYWRSNYATQPWYDRSRTWDDYYPAVQVGYTGYGRYSTSGRTFDQAEADLRRDYENVKGRSALGWEHAKGAARAAWDRVANPRQSRTTSGSTKY